MGWASATFGAWIRRTHPLEPETVNDIKPAMGGACKEGSLRTPPNLAATLPIRLRGTSSQIGLPETVDYRLLGKAFST